jgi:hypothetical protein
MWLMLLMLMMLVCCRRMHGANVTVTIAGIVAIIGAVIVTVMTANCDGAGIAQLPNSAQQCISRVQHFPHKGEKQ